MVEPELAYMPWKKKEEKKGTLIVNTFLYDYYDINTNCFVGQGSRCYTQIVIKDVKTSQIIYCNKYNTSLSYSYYFYNIPLGLYSVRVIRALYGAQLDNKEYLIKMDQFEYEYNIYLAWVLLKVEQYYENKPLKYRVDQDRYNRVNINNVEYLGGVKYKFYDFDNVSLLHNDDYIYSYYKNYLNTLEDSIRDGFSTDMYGNGGASSFLSLSGGENSNNIGINDSLKYCVDYPQQNPLNQKHKEVDIKNILGLPIFENNKIISYKECNLNLTNSLIEQVGSRLLKIVKTTIDTKNENIAISHGTAYNSGLYVWLDYYNKNLNIYTLKSTFDNSSGGSNFSYLFYSPFFRCVAENIKNTDETNYDISVINKKWFKTGLNHIQIIVNNAKSNIVGNWITADSGIIGNYINDINLDNESELEQNVEYFHNSLQGDISVNKIIYDLPSQINQNSLFYQQVKHNMQIYKKCRSLKKPTELLYIISRKIKYLDNLFYADAFPIDPENANSGGFYCTVGFRESFSEDYENLPIKEWNY